MRVSVFGLGYVGSVSAASFAADGHHVIGVDVNPDKVAAINAGRSPIVEPGLAGTSAGAALGASLVFVTPNPKTLTVGAHTFWLDPQHLRPIPPELFKFYLEVEGFTNVSVRTFEPSEKRLNESVPEGPIRDNVKLLNETLFGDRDYAVIGRAPER